MDKIDPGSFRDPKGFLFQRDGILYRQINHSYKEDYEFFINSGLYQELLDKGLIIPHIEVEVPFADSAIGFKIIKPEFIDFISYPYEWSFSQLKDAALLTLKIQILAFEKGMSLKDSSAYNIQFHNGKPIFIDTLSFEKYKEGEPWIAYRQFCQHFLSPLTLMSLRDIRLGQLLRIYIDGIPLDLTKKLLPRSAYFKISLYMHLILHSKSQIKYQNKAKKKSNRKISRIGFLGIINSLESAVKKLKWEPKGTEWDDYYNDTNYSPEAIKDKKRIILNYIEDIKPDKVWDIGANTGLFSRIASDNQIPTLAFDIDPSAVEKNYLSVKANKETDILPLLLDLTNPSPGIGWENIERTSFIDRGPVKMILSLALIHHLAISNNVPFSKIASFFYNLCEYLIIEFIPKEDSQVQRLLSSREDIFSDYTLDRFEREFSIFFDILVSEKIKESKRRLYLLKKKK